MEIVKTVRLSKTAESQLNWLKRITGIKQWNILCRWALCRSLAEPSPPSPVPIKTDSNIEIAWETFGGEIADTIAIALKQRCKEDGLTGGNAEVSSAYSTPVLVIEAKTLKEQFTLHLHRGIGYLAGDISTKNIEDLVNKNGKSS